MRAEPEHPDDARLLLELGREVMGTLDLQQVLSRSFAALRQLVAFDGGAIELVEDGYLVPAATYPPSTLAPLPGAAVAAAGDGAHVAGARAEPPAPACRVSGVAPSHLSAPLEAGGPAIGALRLDSWRARAFGDGERARVLAFAPTIATAVLNAQLHAREVQALRRLSDLECMRARLALHDPLTRLPNGACVAQVVDDALRGGGHLGVLVLALDRFEDVLLTLGPHHADALVVAVARRLQAHVRAGETIGRLRGEVFALVLQTRGRTAALRRVADRLTASLHAPFEVAGLALDVSASVGGAAAPEHGGTAERLLQRAEAAARVARESQVSYALHAPEREQESVERFGLLSGLRRAIASSELFLEFQPQVDLRSGAPVGAEALVRWRHPWHGVIPAARFIPAAERTALVPALTRHVLRDAIGQCRLWPADEVGLRVAVNVSARNLHEERLAADIAAELARSDLPPERLVVEITESAIMHDPRRALSVLRALAEMGVGLSVDDFGTGHSSLAYLARLPVDEVKIDRSFTATMAASSASRAIVRATIDLARGLGLRVVAEGIEQRDTARRLAEMGCDAGQGHAFLPPSSPARVSEWARERAGGGLAARWADARPARASQARLRRLTAAARSA